MSYTSVLYFSGNKYDIIVSPDLKSHWDDKYEKEDIGSKYYNFKWWRSTEKV